MSRTVTCALIVSLTLSGLLGSALVLAGGEGTGPLSGLGLVVEIDDRRIEAVLGETFEIEIGDAVVRMRVTAKPTRHFARSGLAFDVPQAFSLRETIDEHAGIWELTWGQTTIMVQELRFTVGASTPATHVARAVAAEFDAQATRKTDVARTLGSVELRGIRVETTLAGQRIAQEYLDVPVAGRSLVLMLQDVLGADGAHSRTWQQTLAVLDGSLRTDG